MKKIITGIMLLLLLSVSAGTAWAAPLPNRTVELYRKPGVNFTQLKSLGEEISVSVRPAGEAYFDSSDPFLRQRVRVLSLEAAKKQGWVAIDNSSADVAVKIRITEWGRFRNRHDQNLLEFFALEVRAMSRTDGELILRANARYSRVDPMEESMEKLHEALQSVMQEIFAALKANE